MLVLSFKFAPEGSDNIKLKGITDDWSCSFHYLQDKVRKKITGRICKDKTELNKNWIWFGNNITYKHEFSQMAIDLDVPIKTPTHKENNLHIHFDFQTVRTWVDVIVEMLPSTRRSAEMADLYLMEVIDLINRQYILTKLESGRQQLLLFEVQYANEENKTFDIFIEMVSETEERRTRDPGILELRWLCKFIRNT